MVPPQLAAQATHSFTNTGSRASLRIRFRDTTTDIRFPITVEHPAASTRNCFLSGGDSRGHSTFALASAHTLPDSLSPAKRVLVPISVRELCTWAGLYQAPGRCQEPARGGPTRPEHAKRRSD